MPHIGCSALQGVNPNLKKSEEIFIWRYSVGEIVLNSLDNLSGVRQLFLTEISLSSCKKAKLFSWIIFIGGDKKFPFVILFN